MNPFHQTIAVRRPSMGLALVVGLHVIFVYALIAGLGFDRAVPREMGPLQGEIIEESPKTPADAPLDPPDPTQLIHFRPDVPIPPMQIDDPVAAVEASTDSSSASSGSGGTAGIVPAFIAARVDPRRPLSQPPYPPSEIRAGHEGTLTLELLVRSDGRVGDARVTKSSGFPGLDEAAVNEAKRRWRLLPATRDGAAVEGWTKLSVVFRLDQR